jgi:hypothetical protein
VESWKVGRQIWCDPWTPRYFRPGTNYVRVSWQPLSPWRTAVAPYNLGTCRPATRRSAHEHDIKRRMKWWRLDVLMVTAARRMRRLLELAGGGCWVNARGCLAIRYSAVTHRMQQRSSFHADIIACISLATRLIPIDPSPTINKFQILQALSGVESFWAVPQPPPATCQPPKSKCTYFLCTTTFSPLEHFPFSHHTTRNILHSEHFIADICCYRALHVHAVHLQLDG